ncbi:MAG TPA: HAMP domain-containing sensor histidine kinase [Candidatus Lokiarchaeia archaeon]|nr:HAMP domain-containing sensor histidine kinase [Candidatus Lokiarchaeia archaeon]
MGTLVKKAREQLRINFNDDAPTRRKKLLNILLIVMMGALLSLILAFFVDLLVHSSSPSIINEDSLAILKFFTAVGVLLLTYIISNKVSSKPAAAIMLASLVLIIFFSDSLENIVNGRTSAVFTVPIALSSLIAPPITSIILAIIITASIAMIGGITGIEPNDILIAVNLLVAFIVWLLAYTLERSISNARQNQQNVTFYKDIFSHDINNILQNIKGTGDLINIFLQDGDMEKIKEFLSAISEQASRGASLVMNIRKLSELENARVIPRPIDVVQMLQETIQATMSTFMRKKISIDFTPPEGSWLVDGHDILRNVFENIIQNAIVHNEQDLVTIEVRLSREPFPGNDHGAIKIEFLDNGIGIMPEIKDRIFQPGMARDRKSSGLGLGLSLVKNAITQLGGIISVTDRVDGNHENGSNFIIYLKEARHADG